MNDNDTGNDIDHGRIALPWLTQSDERKITGESFREDIHDQDSVSEEQDSDKDEDNFQFRRTRYRKMDRIRQKQLQSYS